MKAIAFFNNKGGVGKTPLAYHLAWMYQELGVRVLAVDLDPQAHLTWAFLPKSKVEAMWMNPRGIFQAVLDFRDQRQSSPGLKLEVLGEHLALLAGHLDLSLLENSAAGEGLENILRQILRLAGEQHRAEVALVDLGPNLAALNRAAVLACEHFVTPLRTDAFAAVSLVSLGQALEEWKKDGRLSPLGYIVFQLPVRKAGREEWLRELARAYHQEVLGEIEPTIPEPDPYRLAILKPYVGLSGLAEQTHRPMFLLRPADGAIGSHSESVQDSYRDFKELALRIAAACGIPVP